MTTALQHKRTARTAMLARLVIPLAVKADGVDTAKRTFEGLASVWDLDLGGDIIHKGAFTKTIKAWEKGSDALPLLNSHNHFDITSAVGQLISAKETKDGLWTKWEVIPGPDGDRVMERLRPSPTTGRAPVGKMSIGFDPVKFDFEQPEDAKNAWDRIRHLREVDLKEVSLVLFPMAPGAAIDVSSVKTFLSLAQATDPKKVDMLTKHELRKLASRIGNLLAPQSKKDEAEVDLDDEQEGTSTGDAPDDAQDSSAETDQDDADDSTDTDDSADESTDSTDNADDEEPDDAAADSSESAPDGVKVYQYGDALQQRIQRNILRSKLSNHKDNTV